MLKNYKAVSHPEQVGGEWINITQQADALVTKINQFNEDMCTTALGFISGLFYTSSCAICYRQVGCRGSPSFPILCHSDTLYFSFVYSYSIQLYNFNAVL